MGIPKLKFTQKNPKNPPHPYVPNMHQFQILNTDNFNFCQLPSKIRREIPENINLFTISSYRICLSKSQGSKCLLLQMTCLPPWHYSNSWQLRNLMKLFKFYISCNIIACAYLLLFLCLFIVLLFQLQELSFIQINPFGQLTILGTQEVDSGEYECVATNEAGSTSEIVTLEVGCKLFQL